MNTRQEGNWKKTFISDLSYVANECKELMSAPAVLVLEGPMGSGKTTFAKVFIGEEDSMSPSYSVLNESSDILHGDFYRIESPDEIIHLELSMYLETRSYFLVEWGKKYITRIAKEVSEEFSFYLLEIEVNESQPDKMRDFTLSKIENI